MRFSKSMDRNPFLKKRTAVVGGALALAAITIPSAAAQTTETVGLGATDYVGISFWIASNDACNDRVLLG